LLISLGAICTLPGRAAGGNAADSAETQFERAERYFAARDYVSALPLYARVIEDDPKGPYAAAAAFRLGMCNFALGEYDGATAAFAKFEEGWPTSPYLDDAAFLSAQAYFRMGDYHRAFERLLRVISFGEKGRYYDRAVRGVGNLADETLTAEIIRKRLEDYHRAAPCAVVLLKLAKHEIKRGEYEKAMAILEEVASSYTQMREGQEAAGLLAEVRQKMGRDPLAVGVLLPLSGDYAPYGTAMKAAVEIAVEETNSRSSQPITVYYEDTAGNETTAVEAARRLIYDKRVVVLLGPALTAEVRAVAPLSALNQVPLVSPAATDATLAKSNDYVFLTGLTPADETRCIVTYARDVLKAKRFACLYPKNAYGQEMRDAFKNAVSAVGGEYVGDVEYPLLDMTLPPDKREINYSPFTKQVKWLRADVVYLPGHYDEVVRLLPQLSFSDVSAYIMGANGWNENRVIRVGAKYCEGTYFTAAFWQDSPQPLARSFIGTYRRKRSEFPNYLAAQAYDAARIIFENVSPPVADGAEFKSRLAAVRNFDGVTGNITLRAENGGLHKKLVILTVREGEVVEAP